MMESVEIPGLKIKASRIGLGTWAIGGSLWGGTNEQEAHAAIQKALEEGINFIDTAPAYGRGKSEEIVGRAVKASRKREQLILATKVGLNQETENKVFRDLRKVSIFKEIEDSLRRLQVEYIDLYQVHWPDPKTPLNETADTLRKLLEQGKIRAIGVSNFSVEQMIKFRKTAPIHTSQPPFNLFEREAENTVLAYCLKEGIATIGYSGLCRGLLSGKMSKNREFKGDDLRKSMDPKFKEPHFSQYIACAERLKKWAESKYGKSLPALAIRWTLDKNISIALWGARKPDQLQEVANVFGWHLSPQDFKEIDSLIAQEIKDPIGNEFMAPPTR